MDVELMGSGEVQGGASMTTVRKKNPEMARHTVCLVLLGGGGGMPLF